METLKVYDTDKDKCSNDLIVKIEEYELLNKNHNNLKLE